MSVGVALPLPFTRMLLTPIAEIQVKKFQTFYESVLSTILAAFLSVANYGSSRWARARGLTFFWGQA